MHNDLFTLLYLLLVAVPPLNRTALFSQLRQHITGNLDPLKKEYYTHRVHHYFVNKYIRTN